MSPPDFRVFHRDPPQRKVLLPNGVLGMTFFIIAEVMLFAGFISGFIIIKANYPEGMWPPPNQPRLPVEATALNSLVLLTSGFFIYKAGQVFRSDAAAAHRPFLIGTVLGSCFVLVQGFEWVRLIGEGLTLTSSSYGGFFYLIVGVHALHAAAALIALGAIWPALRRGTLSEDAFWTARLFWYFVVLMWPILYWQVYL